MIVYPICAEFFKENSFFLSALNSCESVYRHLCDLSRTGVPIDSDLKLMSSVGIYVYMYILEYIQLYLAN